MGPSGLQESKRWGGKRKVSSRALFLFSETTVDRSVRDSGQSAAVGLEPRTWRARAEAAATAVDGERC